MPLIAGMFSSPVARGSGAAYSMNSNPSVPAGFSQKSGVPDLTLRCPEKSRSDPDFAEGKERLGDSVTSFSLFAFAFERHPSLDSVRALDFVHGNYLAGMPIDADRLVFHQRAVVRRITLEGRGEGRVRLEQLRGHPAEQR